MLRLLALISSLTLASVVYSDSLTTEIDPSYLTHGCINVLSGTYQESHQDIVVRCAQPFTIHRSHNSAEINGKHSGVWHFWREGIVVEEPFYYALDPDGGPKVALSGGTHYVTLKSDELGTYSCGSTKAWSHAKKTRLNFSCPSDWQPNSFSASTIDLLNTSMGTIGGQTSPQNLDLSYRNGEFVLTRGNGERRYFRTCSMRPFFVGYHGGGRHDTAAFYFFLDRIVLPNGNQICYRYRTVGLGCKLELFRIESLTADGELLGWAEIRREQTDEKNCTLQVACSDGQWAHYHYTKERLEWKTKGEERWYTNSRIKDKTTHRRCGDLLTRVELSSGQVFDYGPCWNLADFHPWQIENAKLPRRPLRHLSYFKADGTNSFYYPSYHWSCPPKEMNPRTAVSKIREPVGKRGQLRTTGQFFYFPAWELHGLDRWVPITDERTEVIDALDYRKTYTYDGCFRPHDVPDYRLQNGYQAWRAERAPMPRLTSCSYYSDRGRRMRFAQQLYSKEVYEWQLECGSYGMGQLKAKSIQDADGCNLARRSFDYDENGNIAIEKLEGDVTGQDDASILIRRTFSDDGFNLMLSEIKGDLEIRYSYKPKTNLCTAKLTYWKGVLKERQFFEYDRRAALITEIHDNGSDSDPACFVGVTERKVTRITPVQEGLAVGLPEIVEELYWDPKSRHERLFKRTVNHYNQHNLIVQQDIYDADGEFRYALYTTYDEHDRVICRTDALGQMHQVSYDEEGRVSGLVSPRGDHETTFLYDQASRLIYKQTKQADGDLVAWQYDYDLKSQKEAEWDITGSETRYEHDALGRCTRVTHPDGTCVTRDYDVLGNVTSETDEIGNTTTRCYTILGQPTQVCHPDGSEESYHYSVHGHLLRETSRSGLTTEYERDYQGRILKQDQYSVDGELLSTRLFEYAGSCLVRAVDPEGVETRLQYDGAGRLLEEQTENRRTSYEWDQLGRKSREIHHSGASSTVKCWEYDLLNRVIEERVEGLDGAIFTRSQFDYDADNNQTLVATFTADGERAETHTEYDFMGRPVRVTQPDGNEFLYHYDYVTDGQGKLVLQITEIDPLGVATFSTHDTRGRLVCVEKRDPLGTLLQQTDLAYDGVGNKIREEHLIIADGEIQRSFGLEWEHDACNRIIRLEEGIGTDSQRTTYYDYNEAGQLIKTVMPSRKVTTRSYDALGRLKQLQSDDIGYSYRYDGNNRLLEVCGTDSTTTLRDYDGLGNLLSETLANGTTLRYNYDRQGRLIALYLPGGSSTHYQYNAAFITTVERRSSACKPLYSAEYTEMDPTGRVCAMQLPGTCGSIEYTWSRMGRCHQIESEPYFAYVSPKGYDAVGNLRFLYTNDPRGGVQHQFSYDQLNQLAFEYGVEQHGYAHDSLSNRINYDDASLSYDSLNQLLSDAKTTYAYDADGRLVRRSTGDNETHFSYDGLGRLTSIQTSDTELHFTYDAFHRRTSKTCDGQTQYFLYQRQDEIGALDAQGELIQYRALGRGYGAEIGAAVAIELNGTPYVPIHDIRGCVVSLLSLYGEPVTTYRYTAFGTRHTFGSEIDNPWHFCSKRTDEETGLVYFGRRYYDPNCGRWITPDPKGYAQGPNLYAYCENGPLTKLDPYGLAESNSRPKGYPQSDTAGVSPIQAFAQLTGKVIEFIGNHIAPDPISRTALMYVGAGLQGRDVTFNDIWPRPVVGPSPSSSCTSEFVSLGHVDGILNTEGHAKRAADRLSAGCDGLMCEYFHIPSWGFVHDVYRCILNYLGISTGEDKLLAAHMQDRLDRLKPGGFVFQSAHSRGVMVLDKALDRIPQAGRNHIIGVTMGGPLWIRKGKAHYVLNGYVKRDLVGWLAVPRCGWRWQMKDYDQVVVPDSRTSLVPHRLLGGDYEGPWSSAVHNIVAYCRRRFGEATDYEDELEFACQ